MNTARAQPFSINIVDDVKPFESPRPARKPRARPNNAAASTARKSAVAAQTKAQARAKAQTQVAAPQRTAHYALRLEPITLGPAQTPSPAAEPEVKAATPRSRQAEILEKLRGLVRPVTLAAERRQAIIWWAGAFAMSLGLLFAGLHGAIGLRQRSDARMSQIERQIAIRTHNVAVRARDVGEAHAIDNTNMGSRDFDRVLADLAWTEAAKSPDSRLRGWSWSPDQFIADANRPAAFAGADRPVRRRTGAAKKGLWSFMVTQASSGRLSPAANAVSRGR